ncbi:hypothetical protein FB645_001111 [Coemansia sp. IMI 203386]|nr:hypothetical protein FB645_001111 [Coemansia sp. IMI 203386]
MLFSTLVQGQVNRATKQTSSLGGKGQNFAFATRQLYGHSDRVTLLQILGGTTGSQIEALETSLGFDFITVPTQNATRICTTCLDAHTGQMTELVGISEPIEERVAEQYEKQAIELLKSESAPMALALCGSSPPGLNPSCIANIVSSRQPKKTVVFVDSASGILPVLQTGCVDILKINSDEITAIAKRFDAQFDASAKDHIVSAALLVSKTAYVNIVAVTDGPSKAYLVDSQKDQVYSFAIPDLLANKQHLLDGKTQDDGFGNLTLNPLGAGDTCSAVMLNLVVDGHEIVEAFAQGLAAASASCLVPMPNCVFDKQVSKRIRDMLLVTPI